MVKKIETDWQTFIKFWVVPLIIIAALFVIYKAMTGLTIIGVSILLALALKPLVRKVNNFFTRHFGRDKVIFMVSDSVFETYSKRRAVFDRYFRKLTEERYRMMSHSKEIEEILEEGQDYLGKIRDCNDIIKDKVISQKLDRMERVVEAIFHEIDVNPSRARGSKLDVFLNYYLPTTEKLLEAYIDNSEKKVQSKSTEKMQIDITRALDTINVAFEGLLEWFYKKKERDIVGEIFAMEKITAQEGLQSNGIE